MIFATAAAAEAGFYQAFQDADLSTMMAVWEATDDIICIHPMSERLQGVMAVSQSWQQIFAAEERLSIVVSDVNEINSHDLVIRVVVENITLINNPRQAIQPMLATNAYRYTGQGWRMVLHHASPAPESIPIATTTAQTLH